MVTVSFGLAPKDADFPNPEDCPRLKDALPPKHALGNVMDAIDGDGSPWSYMCICLFAERSLTRLPCGMDVIGIRI